MIYHDFYDVLAIKPDPASFSIIDEEEQQKIRHRERLEYLPVVLELLRKEYPEGYELINDYFFSQVDNVTMWHLVEKYGLTIDMVRYRLERAKEKLKMYIIIHEN